MISEANQVIEQRAYERFKVNAEAYMVFTSYPSVQCKIIDISEKGISFRYNSKGKPTEKELMTILINEGEVFLKDMWFIPVSDCEIKNTKERKCGGKFADLTFSQKAKLEFFIKNYTSLT
jgi:PilZ domain-containing protein